jgi:hypothetical protein
LVARAGEELKKPSPDKITLKGLLSGIADEAKSVASIVGAVISLKDLVATALGQ